MHSCLLSPSVKLARICWLDHISGVGVISGIGSSGVSTDLAMFGVDGDSGENREMTEESRNHAAILGKVHCL